MEDNKIYLGEGEDKQALFTSTSVPAYFIEGLIGEKVTEIYKSIEVLKNGDELEKLEPMDLRNSKATIAVARLELNELYLCLKDMKDSSLNPRHKAVRKLSTLLLKKIDEVADDLHTADSPDDPAVVESVKNILRFLEDTMDVMADMKGKTATKYIKEYKDEFKHYAV